MQTDSAFLDDLIRATWNGDARWKSIQIDTAHGFDASFADAAVRAFVSYRKYQVSPGGFISETDHHVEKQDTKGIYCELEAPRAWKKELWTAISFRAWELDQTQKQNLSRQGFLIRFSGGDPRGQNIFYQEKARHLIIYVETPGLPGVRWQAGKRSLREWTDPVDKDIDPATQEEIKSRIVAWSESQGALVRF